MAVTFGSNLIVIGLRWSSFKTTVAAKGLALQYVDEGDYYAIFALDSGVVYSTNIWKGVCPASADYTQEDNDSDKAEFEAGYMSGGNKSILPRVASGIQRVVSEKTTVSRLTLYSHDWTDPTTWLTRAVRVVDEAASDSGNHLTYSLAHTNIIDTYHGKITAEDYVKDAAGHNYRVVVKVGSTTLVEQDPHTGTGGDYTINYNTGVITLASALTGSETVSVTYHYANGSEFIVAPAAGKVLKVDVAEVQFSDDVELTDSAVFQVYGLVDVFAPQYVAAGVIPTGTKIPLGDPVIYKTMTDYQNDALRAYPTYPPLGGSGWRGTPKGVTVLDWDYVSSTELRASMGLEIRIKLEHDVPFGGYYATATFYCTSEPE